MARYLFDTNEVFFPVDLCRLYWESPDKRDMFGNLQIACDDFFAVVDLEKDYLFATVTKDYELIPNREAAELGFELTAHLFSDDNTASCYAPRYWTTAKRSELELDILCDFAAATPLTDEGWKPMVKVVNSYNKKRKLTFYLGFCQVDGEGEAKGAFLIPGLTLELSSTHTSSMEAIRRLVFAKLDQNPDMDVERIVKTFQNKMEQLKKVQLTQRNMQALCCKIFGFSSNKADGETAEALQKATAMIKEQMTLKNGKGDAYGFFVAMSLFATTYDKFARRAQTTKSQLQLGAWMEDFAKASASSQFQIRKYLSRR